MSRRINTTLSSPEALTIAEMAERMHFAVATSPNADVAGCWTPTYKASKRMFTTAIKAAYPHMDAERVYLLWVDCNETVAYCVRYIRENNRYPF